MAPCNEDAWGRGVTGMAHLPGRCANRLGSLLMVRPTSHSVHTKHPFTLIDLHDPPCRERSHQQIRKRPVPGWGRAVRVEVPGIEPGSCSAPPGLLRAQLTMSLLVPT